MERRAGLVEAPTGPGHPNRRNLSVNGAAAESRSAQRRGRSAVDGPTASRLTAIKVGPPRNLAPVQLHHQISYYAVRANLNFYYFYLFKLYTSHFCM